jgi:hypothetical protein
MVGRALRSVRAHLDEDRPHSGHVADLSIELNEDQVLPSSDAHETAFV